MGLRVRREWVVVLIALVVAASSAALYYTVGHHAVTPFQAQLSEQADFVIDWPPTGLENYTRLLLTFSSPATLGPSDVRITVVGPGGTLLLPDGERVSALNVSYVSYELPCWTNITHTGSLTMFDMTFLNPNGTVVCGFPPNSAYYQGPLAPSVQSGAEFIMGFPGGGPSGYTITISDPGHPGEATLVLH